MHCNNCKSTVPANIWDLHIATCRRRNYYCSKCLKTDFGSTKDQHEENVHSFVTCECGGRVEKWFTTGHKNLDCPLRKLFCEYCKMEWHAQDLPEHIKACGARTDLCDNCGERVQLRHFEMHVCPPNNQSPISYGCPICDSSFNDTNLLQIHMLEMH